MIGLAGTGGGSSLFLMVGIKITLAVTILNEKIKSC